MTPLEELRLQNVIADRDAWNASFHAANKERLELRALVQRFLELHKASAQERSDFYRDADKVMARSFAKPSEP